MFTQREHPFLGPVLCTSETFGTIALTLDQDWTEIKLVGAKRESPQEFTGLICH